MCDVLIIEGPDNIGKSTAIKQLELLYRSRGEKVQVLRCPDRSDFPDQTVQYYMGPSNAAPLDRQFFILVSSVMNYAKIDPDTTVVIFDRHPAVSAMVYYDFKMVEVSDAMYHGVLVSVTKALHKIIGAKSVTCAIFTGDHPFKAPNQDEHFETQWDKKNQRYNRLKYTKHLPNCGIHACAVDVHAAVKADQLIGVVDGLFSYSRKHGGLPSPLAEAIPTPGSEGGSPSAQVSPAETLDGAFAETAKGI